MLESKQFPLEWVTKWTQKPSVPFIGSETQQRSQNCSGHQTIPFKDAIGENCFPVMDGRPGPRQRPCHQPRGTATMQQVEDSALSQPN